MTEHEPGCPLRGVPWLAGDAGAAALAGRTLEDGGAPVPGLDVWAELGLSAALRRAAPAPGDQRLAWCACGSAGRTEV